MRTAFCFGPRAVDVLVVRVPMAIIYSIWSFHFSHAYSSRGSTKPDGWRDVERKEVGRGREGATVTFSTQVRVHFRILQFRYHSQRQELACYQYESLWGSWSHISGGAKAARTQPWHRLGRTKRRP